jgi:hypothetical protein
VTHYLFFVCYVCTLGGSLVSLVYTISVLLGPEKITHGELHGTVPVRMPLVINFSLLEKLLISANHFVLVVLIFGTTEKKDNEDKVIGANKSDNIILSYAFLNMQCLL